MLVIGIGLRGTELLLRDLGNLIRHARTECGRELVAAFVRLFGSVCARGLCSYATATLVTDHKAYMNQQICLDKATLKQQPSVAEYARRADFRARLLQEVT